MPGEMTVIKLNTRREETWRYTGRQLEATSTSVLIEAFFDRADINLDGMVLARGDRFVEVYYSDRWYNIFEIYGRAGLKGWYCNISLPAEIEFDQVRYVDLALDLLVFPDGRQVVLDEDEFATLKISSEIRQGALAALAQLQGVFSAPEGVRLTREN